MSITFVATAENQASSVTSFTIALGHTVAVGDLLVVMIGYVNGLSAKNSPTVSDNVNSGNYITPAQLSFYNSTNQQQITYAYKICTAAGTPTVTISGLSTAAFMTGQVCQYTGFVNTPTPIIPDISSKFGSSTSPSATTLTNSYAKEVVICYMINGSATASAFTGTINNQRDTNNSVNEYLDLINATSGNTQSFGCTLSPSVAWGVVLAGFADTPAAFDLLNTATNTDLVLYNQNWNYLTLSNTNFIEVGSTGAFCNNQTGGNTVNAIWAGQQFTADHNAQCTLVSFVTNAFAGVGVRMSNGSVGPNGYVAYFDTGHWNLGLLNNAAFSSLSGGPQPRTNNAGDVVLLQAQGSTITLLVNGTALKTVTDTTWAQGSPALAFNGPHPSTVVDAFYANSLGILVPSYQINSLIGQVGRQVSEALTHQTIASSGSSSGLTVSLSDSIGSISASFAEGQLINVLNITGQTATFAEGSLTTSISGGSTLTLGPQTGGFAQGQLFDNISYVLDQGALTVNLFSQTATFTEGLLTNTVGPALTAETVTTTEGTITDSLTLQSATAQTITSAEGVLTANLGNNVTLQLIAQTLSSAEGVISGNVSYVPSANTPAFTVGTLTFSNSGTFAVQLGAQILASTEGIIALNIPVGTGPPLFIPPQLGKPVTTRTFSWGEMAQRAWGSEFRAPDHRIYQFSGGNYKDSTDLGTTGIYTNQQGPADNP